MRFLLTTFGSSGDLNPFLCLAQELKQRGHTAVLAGNPTWEEGIRRAGIEFRPAGPIVNVEEISSVPDVLSKEGWGPKAARAFITHCLEPGYEKTLEDLLLAAPEFDCLISHHVVLMAHIVAEKTGIPYVSAILAPCMSPSRDTLPAGTPFHPLKGAIGKAINSAIWRLGRRKIRGVLDSGVNRFRTAHGLPAMSNTFFQSVSSRLVLYLYSEHFYPRCSDWTNGKHLTGFTFWDTAGEPEPELVEFLNAGAKPVLFTLGTLAVANPLGFYEAASDAVKGSKYRAILLVGKGKRASIGAVPENVFVAEYAPYGWLMPRCAVAVHQCGIGTTAQALRAGIPSIGCPFSFDQLNNALRLVELGAGRCLNFKSRTAEKMRRTIGEVMNGSMSARAAAIGQEIRKENGAARACDVLEEYMVR